MIRTRIVNDHRLTAARVAEITGGRLMRPGRQAKRVTIDSRDVQHNHMVNDVIRALAQWDGWERLSRDD